MASLESGLQFARCIAGVMDLLKQLLASSSSDDVKHAITLLILARQFEIDGAEESLRKMLPLVRPIDAWPLDEVVLLCSWLSSCSVQKMICLIASMYAHDIDNALQYVCILLRLLNLRELRQSMTLKNQSNTLLLALPLFVS